MREHYPRPDSSFLGLVCRASGDPLSSVLRWRSCKSTLSVRTAWRNLYGLFRVPPRRGWDPVTSQPQRHTDVIVMLEVGISGLDRTKTIVEVRCNLQFLGRLRVRRIPVTKLCTRTIATSRKHSNNLTSRIYDTYCRSHFHQSENIYRNSYRNSYRNLSSTTRMRVGY